MDANDKQNSEFKANLTNKQTHTLLQSSKGHWTIGLS